jgi:hypothetical protein
MELWDILLSSATPKSGYIVQEIMLSTRVYKCGGSLSQRKYYHFWEIASTNFPGYPNGVIPAGSSAGTGFTDEWSSLRARESSYGTTEVRAWGRFYYVTTTGILNWGRAVPQSSSSTTTRPSFWDLPPDNGEPETYHKTTVLWNCCCAGGWSRVFSDPPAKSVDNLVGD